MQSNGDCAAIEAALRTHERRLWSICYRMTGSAADADELVQETFLRALAEPPRLDGPLEAWLTQVAMNLSRDVLRKRRRMPYRAPLLPEPVDTDDASEFEEGEQLSPDGRYDQLESLTRGCLLALEALSPQQRSVLLLREVFDYSVSEAAAVLELSEANVRTIHLRARRAMSAYEAAGSVQTRAARQSLVGALQSRNLAAVDELLPALFEHVQRFGTVKGFGDEACTRD